MNKYIEKTKQLLKSFFKDPLFLSRWEDPYYSRHRDDNQLSVRISSQSNKTPNSYNGDSYMFIEDMSAGIMPFMIYRGEREKYPTRIEPHSQEKENLIADGISGRGHRNYLADSLCGFVRTTTQVLFQDGVAFYEIIYKKNESGDIESFDLKLIQPFCLFRMLGSYYQYVLWREAKKSRVRVQIIKIPIEKILRIDIPKQLGGRRNINKILKRLWELSREIIPKFQMDAMAENKNIGFDLAEFSRAKYLEIAKLTNVFGWNQRQRSDNYITEYYSMLRFLRKKKVEAIIRNEIILKLNQTLNGSILNIRAKIIMENLFTVEDVEKQEKALKDGDVVFMDLSSSLKV